MHYGKCNSVLHLAFSKSLHNLIQFAKKLDKQHKNFFSHKVQSPSTIQNKQRIFFSYTTHNRFTQLSLPILHEIQSSGFLVKKV